MNAELDHLVVVADSLEQGADWCRETLGVVPGPGGRHAAMGTHNRLLAIGGPAFPRSYLEIIAIDPDAGDPGRPRWFGLDDPALRKAVRDKPRLHHVVLRTRAIEMMRWGLINRGLNPGEPIAAERRDAGGRLLRWRILLRSDGRIECDGTLPTLIEWQDAHPADSLPESGVELVSLGLPALPAAAAALIRPRGIRFCGEAPGLRCLANETAPRPGLGGSAGQVFAILRTPLGERRL